MKVGKIPVAPIVLLLIFGSKFIVNVFFPGKSATLDPVFTGIMEIAIVVTLIYYITLFVKWLYNYRKAA